MEHKQKTLIPPSGYICPHCYSKERQQRYGKVIKAASKYILLTAAGVALFFWASKYAYIQRSYKAYGGECFFLLLPLFYKLTKDIAADFAEIIKQSKGELEQ